MKNTAPLLENSPPVCRTGHLNLDANPALLSTGSESDCLKTNLFSGTVNRSDGEASLKSPLPRQPWTRRRFLVFLALMVLLGLRIQYGIKRTTISPTPALASCHDYVRNNGTHDFRRTVLLVSIDGFRADYLHRGLTPHLLDISKDGVRAKSMKPIFPSLTFPNHWSLMTGLYAESHGIVANDFWDPQSERHFKYTNSESTLTSSWWLGEPMWETAHKAGIITADIMWPGPLNTSTGVSPTHFIPWRDNFPIQEKLDHVVTWIDLPFEERPQLILVYEQSLDQAGHRTGPQSANVDQVLQNVDEFARDLRAIIEARNLTDIVDLIFVSDHGMADTTQPELVYVDDILGDDFERIEHIDGWPSMGLWFGADTDIERQLDVLVEAAAASGGKFNVYSHMTMPERYHLAGNNRVAPIYLVPKIGYALTDTVENGTGMSAGNHGYDNEEPSMHAIFIAHGPFAFAIKEANKGRARQLDQGWYPTTTDTSVLATFSNVQVYNLVMKLLGIEQLAAPTNGTMGFWDQYL